VGGCRVLLGVCRAFWLSAGLCGVYAESLLYVWPLWALSGVCRALLVYRRL